MTRKGRFQLLSYLIDDNLIYYKSLNKKRKIVAFALFEMDIISPIISTLNRFLIKRFLKYYAIQMDTLNRTNKILLVNFEEKKKESIIKIFDELKHNLLRVDKTIRFFKNSKLERKFIEPIVKNSDYKVTLIKKNSSILLLNHNDTIFLNIYNLNLDYLENLETFINNFLKLNSSFNRKGYLIFNFKIDMNNQIVFNPFFVEKCNKDDELFNTENSINTFFNYTMLEKQNIKIKQIFHYLWRLGVSENYLYLNNFNKIFIKKDQNKLIELVKFNKRIEQNLMKNQIDFIRLGKNLLFIEDKLLVVVLTELKSEYIQKIVEKYHHKYYLSITILNEEKNQKLLEIPEIKSMRNLKICSSEELLNFNYERFRNNQ